jgi:hypothetical protein
MKTVVKKNQIARVDDDAAKTLVKKHGWEYCSKSRKRRLEEQGLSVYVDSVSLLAVAL